MWYVWFAVMGVRMPLGCTGAGHLCQAVSGIRMSMHVQRVVLRGVQYNRETTYGPGFLMALMSIFPALMSLPG